MCAALAAGALEAFAVDPSALIYKQSAGASVWFAMAVSNVYRRAAGTLPVSTAIPSNIVYKVSSRPPILY